MLAIVQARLESSRFPGKMLQPLAGRPVLARVLGRLQCVPRLDRIIVATAGPGAQQIADLAGACNVDYRVDKISRPNDVLRRFIGVLDHYDVPDDRAIVRVCGDNPLLVPAAITTLIRHWHVARSDYCGFWNPTAQLPMIRVPTGYFAEVVRAGALRRLHRSIGTSPEREDVTSGIYNQVLDGPGPPGRSGGGYCFSLSWLEVPDWYLSWGPPDTAIDLPEDLARVERYLGDRRILPREVWP